MPDTTTTTTHETGTHPAPLRQLNRDLTALPGAASLPLSGAPYVFAPDQGTPVVQPPGSGQGWWAGAPGVLWTGDRYYLSYRIRRPQPQRGGITQIAVSADGVRFDPIWTADKADFTTSSIERSSLALTDDGVWRLYVSYVDGDDGRWRIDLMEARSPDAFDPSARRPVLTAAGIGAEGVKDPWVSRLGDGWCMIASYAPAPAVLDVDPARLHATKDVYNTGLTKSLTGLATSDDGVDWRWDGSILQPRADGWDAYASRLNSIVGTADGWLGYYDGSASVAENYEERCGTVRSDDLRHWHRVGDGPTVGAASGPGSVRYLDSVQTSEWIRFYYEYTRHDGSHELRTHLVNYPSATVADS